MSNFIANGASELPDVKIDLRSPTGATTEWAAEDANDLRQAAIDLRAYAILETQERVAADTAIIASGASPSDVNLSPVIATGSTTARAIADRFADMLNVKDFGAVGDGVTDDTAAFAAWATAMPASGARMFVPEGVYIVTPGDFLTLSGKSDFMIEGYGATLKAADGADHSIGKHMLYLASCANGTVAGITFDGNRAARTPAEVLAYQVLIGSSNSGITLRDVRSINSCIDGFYIGSPGVHTNHSEDILLDNCGSDNAYRNGLSIITGKRITIRGGSYRATVGTAPQEGIDIEPDFDDQIIEDILVQGASFWGNAGAGAQVLLRSSPSVIQRRIIFDSCLIHDNDGVGVAIYYPNMLTFVSCDIYENHSFGVDWECAGNDVTFLNTSIRRNEGRGMALSPQNGTGTAARTVFVGCRFLDNGTASAGTQAGIGVSPAGSGAVEDVSFIGCTFANVDGANQRYGLTTAAGVSGLKIIGCVFDGATTAPAVLGDDAATRHVSGNTGFALPQRVTLSVSADRGDADRTLTVGTDVQIQRFSSALSQNRTVTLSTTGAAAGDTFRVVRTGLGAFTLNVGGVKTIPNSTAAYVDVVFDGSGWALTGYGTL